MQQVETSLKKAERAARSGDADAKVRLAVLKRCKEVIDQEQPLRSAEWNVEEQAIVRSFGFITAKDVLYVCNVHEDELDGTSGQVAAVSEWVNRNGGRLVVVCARIESELAELEDADRDEMLESLEMSEPALAVVARAAYDLLGLQSYFTAGEKEIRAWTIRKESTAPQAAGVIHTDFERGFIRAECYLVDELDEYKSEKSIREAGKLRSEGKDYVMQDGDIVHFLFNV